MSVDIEGLADRLVAARRGGALVGDVAGGEQPTTQAEAFAVQDAVLARLGGGVAAWKVGGAPGTDNTCGPVLAGLVMDSPARLDGKACRLMAVECELAFRLGRDLPVRAQPYTTAEAHAALDTMYVAIEQVEARVAAWPKAPGLVQLADFMANAALIVGSPQPVPASVDVAKTRVQLEIGGKIKKDQVGTYAGGDPFALIAWLANHLAQRAPVLSGRGLKAGDVITTGSWTSYDFAGPGQTVRAIFPGIGEASLSFV